MHMRAALFAVAVGTSFVVACGQSQSPTAPASPSSAGPSQTLATPADHTLPPDESFTVHNPCTGADTTLTVHWLKFVSRLEGGATGEEHDTIQGVGEWSTTDGFSGRLNYGFSGLKDPADQVFQIDMEHQSQTGGNGGQRVVVHGVAQFVRKDGVTLVQFEKFSLECVGKPVG